MNDFEEARPPSTTVIASFFIPKALLAICFSLYFSLNSEVTLDDLALMSLSFLTEKSLDYLVLDYIESGDTYS